MNIKSVYIPNYKVNTREKIKEDIEDAIREMDERIIYYRPVFDSGFNICAVGTVVRSIVQHCVRDVCIEAVSCELPRAKATWLQETKQLE